MKISVVAPLYRSAPYIEELHGRCVSAVLATGVSEYEVIFVNDASPDDSLMIAKRIAASTPGVVVIDLSRNFGQHRAIMTGIAAATGNYVFVMDSDLEEDPEWITLFYKEMMIRDCDVVYGVNNNVKRGLLYALARRAIYPIINHISGITFPVNVCAARLMTRRYVDALLQFQEREMYLSGIFHMAGFSQLPIEVVKHDTSPSTYSARALVNLLVNAITAFSIRPLTMISLVGICISLIAFVFTSRIVYMRLMHGISVEGWASVMAANLSIGGLILFFNGVMAIYIGKIFLEVKGRPRTIIKEYYRSPERNAGGTVSVDAKCIAEIHRSES